MEGSGKMRKVLYIFLMAVTFFCAGFYEKYLFMLLFLVECFLFLCGWLVPNYLIRHMKLSIKMDSQRRCGEVIQGKVIVKNEGKLPVPFFHVFLSYQNELLKEKPEVKKRKGFVAAKEEAVMDFQMLPLHCGIFCVTVTQLQVLDYLSLFSKKKKEKKKAVTVVIPEENHTFSFPEKFLGFQVQQEETDDMIPSKEPPMIEGIRNYEYGDSMRDIHWKLSAREDKLYSKIYQKDTVQAVSLYADISHDKELEATDIDIFLEMLDAVQRDLLKKGIRLYLWWYDKNEVSATIVPIRTVEDIAQGFFRLLFDLSADPWKKDEREQRIVQEQMEETTLIRVTMNLECYLQDKLFYSCTKEQWKKEGKTERYYG